MTECLEVLLTLTCSDDLLRWDAVAGATGYVIVGWGWSNLFAAPLFVVTALGTSYPIACLDESMWLMTYSLNEHGIRSEEATPCFWHAGGGRRLTALHGGPKMAPLCGGAP